MDQPRLGKRELICLLSFTCNYVVFVWRGFLFLWVLGMGYVILSWHSLSLPYNYFGVSRNFKKGLLLLKVVVLPNFNEIIFLQSSLFYSMFVPLYPVSMYAIAIFCVMMCAQVNLIS